ncbi:MAG: hypothetical protein EXS35_14960 [Pedosphaera sp.]|nr:hypothetical protein [Pedosphaera sp.]
MLCGLCVSLRAQSDDFAIDWFSLDSGGGTSSDDVYSLSGTVGQPDAGELSEAVFAVTGGFWAAAVEAVTSGPPALLITRVGANLVLSWSASATGFYLEVNPDLFQPGGWHFISQPISVVNGLNTVTVPASGAMEYYRLTDTPNLPRLAITRAGKNVVVSWPAAATGYFLEQNLDMTRSTGWAFVASPVVVSNGQNTVTLPASGRRAFYRLTRAATSLVLNITRSGNNVILSWPASATGYFLEENLSANQPEGWALVRSPVVVAKNLNTVTLPISGDTAYFRLAQTPSALVLKIARSGKNVIVSWPAAATGFFLEQNSNPSNPYGWSLVGLAVTNVNGRSTVTIPASGSMTFFRLTQNPAPPQLNIVRAGTNAVISWTAPSTGYYLEQNMEFGNPNSWLFVMTPPVVTNGQNTITLPLGGFSTFYRLTPTPHGPALRFELTGTNTAVISWPAPSTGYSLQRNAAIGANTWISVTNVPVEINSRKQVVLPFSTTNSFFRLKYP